MFNVAYEVISPMLVVAGLGVLLGWYLKPDPRTLSSIAIYLFLPAIIFEKIVKTNLGIDEIGKMALLVFASSALIALIAWWVARKQKGLSNPVQSAFILSVMLANTGNFGLPFVQFAFGSEGLERAAIIVVLMNTVTYTLGIYVASWGTVPVRQALVNILRVPFLYAAIAAVVLNVTDVTLPLPIVRSINLLSQGSIPIFLVVLGIQLGRIKVRRETFTQLRTVGFAVMLRLILAPLIILVLTSIIGITGLSRDIALVQLSMPTAVSTAMLATEFGSDAEFITLAILISVFGSLISLAVLMTVFV